MSGRRTQDAPDWDFGRRTLAEQTIASGNVVQRDYEWRSTTAPTLRAALLRRCVLIHDNEDATRFEGEWVAVPREDYEQARAALAAAPAAPALDVEVLLGEMGAAWHPDWDYEVSQGYRKDLRRRYDEWYAGNARLAGAAGEERT